MGSCCDDPLAYHRPPWAAVLLEKKCGPCGGMSVGSIFRDRLDPGGVLQTGDVLNSIGGTASLLLQADGNLVLREVSSGNVLWSTKTNGRPATHAVMQGDGNFVLLGDHGEVFWACSWDQGDIRPGSYLQLQDDGNLVIYRRDRSVGWSSHSEGFTNRQDKDPCDILHPLNCVPAVKDFLNSAVGKGLLHVLSVATMTELLTALPGIGMQIANAISALGPAGYVVQDMLPAVASGAPVGLAFVQSVKNVALRAATAAGGGALGEIASGLASNAILHAAVPFANNALAAIGTSSNAFANAALQYGEAYAQKWANEQLAKLPYLPDMARDAGVTPEQMQVALDGVTASARYNPANFDANGNLLGGLHLATTNYGSFGAVNLPGLAADQLSTAEDLGTAIGQKYHGVLSDSDLMQLGAWAAQQHPAPTWHEIDQQAGILANVKKGTIDGAAIAAVNRVLAHAHPMQGGQGQLPPTTPDGAMPPSPAADAVPPTTPALDRSAVLAQRASFVNFYFHQAMLGATG